MSGDEDLYYNMDRSRLGLAVILNNLDKEQEPTKKDVEIMGSVLRDIGFEVEIYRNLTSQGMNSVKRKLTEDKLHRDSNCFLFLIISHGTADNFLLDRDGNKTWNIESLVTEVCDVQDLVGKPKLFFIEACRGKENNFSTMMSKANNPAAPCGISLPSKQDVFVGFATVPGFVSLTSDKGSPYLQALAAQLSDYHDTIDLADIHLLVKRKLAGMKIGDSGVCQGAEERSSLLSKLLFARYRGKKRGSIRDGEKVKTPFNFFSLPSSRASSPLPLRRNKFVSQEKPRPMSAVFSSSTFKQFLPTNKLTHIKPPSSSSAISLSRSMSSPSSGLSPLKPLSRKISPPKTQHTTHVVEVKSSDVEKGLNELLDKVKEVYGGEGKVKVKRKNRNNHYSFKYGGPERAASLLESALHNVRELQTKSELWKFTQRLEVTSSMSNLNEVE